jgi:hypothetical protein
MFARLDRFIIINTFSNYCETTQLSKCVYLLLIYLIELNIFHNCKYVILLY